MKHLLTLIFGFLTSMTNGQNKLIPGENAIEKKWIKNEEYKMTFYAMKDTTKYEIAKVATKIAFDKSSVIVITEVSMKQLKFPWIDSTIASAATLEPIYHSSYNEQRDMTLNFGKIVTGIYFDKVKNSTTIINDTTKEDYFDSNIYPTLIRWLQLREGYKQDIAIYDYDPTIKGKVIKASVQNVKKGIYQSKNSGVHPVWIVTVSDEIAGSSNGKSTYYIDTNTRKLWMQEMDIRGSKMMMQLIEN
jgi:hypothetical protein